eukprot:3759339-Pyramimonas_sp.AAC.1
MRRPLRRGAPHWIDPGSIPATADIDNLVSHLDGDFRKAAPEALAASLSDDCSRIKDDHDALAHLAGFAPCRMSIEIMP